MTPITPLSPRRAAFVGGICAVLGHRPAATVVTWRQRLLGDTWWADASAAGPATCRRCRKALEVVKMPWPHGEGVAMPMVADVERCWASWWS